MSSSESASLSAIGGLQTPSRVRTLLSLMRTTPHERTRSLTPPQPLNDDYTPLPTYTSPDHGDIAYVVDVIGEPGAVEYKCPPTLHEMLAIVANCREQQRLALYNVDYTVPIAVVSQVPNYGDTSVPQHSPFPLASDAEDDYDVHFELA